MKVVVWPALGRVGAYATGVGKHVLRMSVGLAAQQGWTAQLLFTSDLWAAEIRRVEASAMDALPGIRLPINRRLLEGLWRTFRRPAVDRWLDDVDWVYCPKELYVPVNRARYAVTVHDVFRLEPKYRHLQRGPDWRWRWILGRALDDANLVLTVSEFTKSRLVDLLGVAEDKIRVVGNGVDEGFFAMADTDPKQVTPYPGQTYILAVGGVTHKKGGPSLLAVAAALRRIAPEWNIVVTGPVAQEFQAAVEALPNVLSVSRGFPDSQMHRLVRGATAALVLSEYEGFGIPALEAMAAGVPVVAADRAALPEVVGGAGLLVEPQDAVAVAELLKDVCSDSSDRARVIQEGRIHAEGFRWGRCVNRLTVALVEFGPNCASGSGKP